MPTAAPICTPRCHWGMQSLNLMWLTASMSWRRGCRPAMPFTREIGIPAPGVPGITSEYKEQTGWLFAPWRHSPCAPLPKAPITHSGGILTIVAGMDGIQLVGRWLPTLVRWLGGATPAQKCWCSIKERIPAISSNVLMWKAPDGCPESWILVLRQSSPTVPPPSARIVMGIWISLLEGLTMRYGRYRTSAVLAG